MADAVVDTKRKEGPNGQDVSTKRTAFEGRYERWKSVREERKEQGREKILAQHLGKRKRSGFCDFENPTSLLVGKKD